MNIILILILKEKLQIAFANHSLGSSFYLGEEMFTNPIEQSNSGFYDSIWHKDTIMGICYFPFDNLSFLSKCEYEKFIDLISKVDYAFNFKNKMIKFYIDLSSSKNAIEGGEQEFGECRIFSSENFKEFAISFDITYFDNKLLCKFENIVNLRHSHVF